MVKLLLICLVVCVGATSAANCKIDFITNCTKIFGSYKPLSSFLGKVVVFTYADKELNAGKSAQMTFPNSFVSGSLLVNLTQITTSEELLKSVVNMTETNGKILGNGFPKKGFFMYFYSWGVDSCLLTYLCAARDAFSGSHIFVMSHTLDTTFDNNTAATYRQQISQLAPEANLIRLPGQ